VFENIRSRMEPTILLTIYSVALAVLIGVPMGIIAAKKRNSLADYTLTFFSAVGMSAPGFWVGLMMVFYLGVQLRLFPTQGYTYIANGGLKGALHSLTMPAVAYAISHISSLARYTRTMMLDVISNDYVRTARAKGLKERIVYYKHALKNALAPVVTNIGFSIATLLGGATVAETVFNINGMGKLAYDSLMRRDYTQQQANLLFTTILLLTINILLDIVYKMLDPRIEFD
jgi:peptide/nickel transport system permease protein